MLDWNALRDTCENCTKCALCQTRTNMVFGVGNPDAQIMFIGEGPGEQEDLQGEPFVGAAGKLLDEMLSIIDLERKDVYIANIVKCRPPGNRDPLDEEQDACIGYLRNQLGLIMPKIIVCLGRIAARRIISPDFKITRDHGAFYENNGFWITSLYHPAALLRDPGKRPETFMDLLLLKEKYLDLSKRGHLKF